VYVRCCTYQNDNDTHDSEAALDIDLLAHDPTDCLSDTDGAFSDDNDGKQAHTLHEMSLLKTEHAPDAGDADSHDGLGNHDTVENHV
jgi:hypothetical protein